MGVAVRGLLVAAVALIGVAAAVASPAQAHERRQVGQYVLVVGFHEEPTYVEELNAAYITVFSTAGQPVEGVEKTLKVEISNGAATRTLDLTPELGKRGGYLARFIPTKTGVYVFRFFGKIQDADINERFESGPNRFDEVVGKGDLQFPAKVPSNAELAAQAQPAQPAAAGTAPSSAAAAVSSATDGRATIALVIGALGLLAGLAGTAIGLYGLSAARAGHGSPSRTRRDVGEPV